MHVSLRASALAAMVTLFSCNVHAIPQVTRVGRYLYNPDGSRFSIKGIAYQEQGAVVESSNNAFGEPSTFTDPLAIPDACKRDLSFLQQLTVNTIRVYSVDSTLNHDDCMSMFSNAGIYTIIDLSLPLNGSIDRNAPSWTTNLLDEYIATIDAFSKYDNVLAFNVGNEAVISNNTAAAPFIKAATREVKAYLRSKNSSVLVGYAAIDGSPDFKLPLANFLSCDPTGANSDAFSIDLHGLNNYEWCGDSTFQESYAATDALFSGYNVAAYFSEYGCITSPPRLWTEVSALYGSNMTDHWVGGIAFSYFPASSVQGQFGMVTISADGTTVQTSDDFNRLQAQLSQVSSPTTPAQSSAPASTYPSCPTTNSTWVASNTLPPTPNLQACDCLENALSCQFTPPTSNYSVIVGQLLDFGCSAIGQIGGSCDPISANGQTGVYGSVSGCDPTIKLSYVMSQNYELSNRNSQACSFNGNGTVNLNAPSPSASSAANAAVSSCIPSPSATFTPTAPSGSSSSSGPSGSGGSGGSSSTSGNGNQPNGAFVAFGDAKALLGVVAMAVVSLLGGVWTLF